MQYGGAGATAQAAGAGMVSTTDKSRYMTAVPPESGDKEAKV